MTSLPTGSSSLTGGTPPLGDVESEGEGARFPDSDVDYGVRENENYRSSFNPIVPILPRPAPSNLPPTARRDSEGKAIPTPEQQVSTKPILEKKVFGTSPKGVIGIHKPRAVVRVARDYSAGELCQFWSGWKEELQGRVSLFSSCLTCI